MFEVVIIREGKCPHTVVKWCLHGGETLIITESWADATPLSRCQGPCVRIRPTSIDALPLTVKS